jgi:ectoine hydroxylase-related dioxygenase (phytanoyl-CoA dioxygenase family)
MTMQDALHQLNVTNTTLSSDEIKQLNEQGYLPLYNILSQDQIIRFRNRLDEITLVEGELAGTEVHQEAGTNRLSNLIDKDPMFDICYTHPRVLAAMNHVLSSDFKISSLNSRASLPGEGLQALHADWGEAVDAGNYQVCNSIWLLVDFTANNGATRVVPGTHRSGQHPATALDDPKAPHPDEIQLIAPAGTVVIFNSHLWHGGTVNHSDAPRYALHSYFCRRDQPQQLDQKAHLSEKTIARLNDAQRYILDV